MEKFKEDALYQILTFVKDSIVFVDHGAAECLHWNNGLSKLLNAGALDVRDIYHTKECLESENKVIFMISTPLSGHVTKYIQRIIVNSDFNHCVVLSILSREVNNFISTHGDAFQYIAQQIRIWMKNEFSSVVVEYVPLFNIMMTSHLFITPVHHNLFPVLPSDVARLQAFLHSRGDKRIFNNLGEVDIGFLPKNMQANIKMLSGSLNEMFEKMNVNEDCYAVGPFSRLLANDLVNMSDAKGRRKVATSRASVVFIDRTLDLISPMSHGTECLLDGIYEVLPRLKYQQNDVSVDMIDLFANGNTTPTTLFPGCLAHDGDEEAAEMMQLYLMKTRKECLRYIISKLGEYLYEENIEFENKSGEDEPLLKRTQRLLKKVRCNTEILQKHCGSLQCIMALINSIKNEENYHNDEILSAEKAVLQDAIEDGKTPLTQIHHILSKPDNNSFARSSVCYLVVCKPLLNFPQMIRFSVVDALMLCLMVYSAGLSERTPLQEEKLKECLVNVLMDGNHREDLLFIVGDLDASERQIRTRVADIFERLNGINTAREGMANFKNLLKKDEFGMVRYTPLLQQVIEQIFDQSKPELRDIEFRSHGFKDFLKTGFGFFMNVAKPRPDDHPLIILFVVGGITWFEVQKIQATIAKLKPESKVLIGSTRIITASDALEQVICTENLFVDVDT